MEQRPFSLPYFMAYPSPEDNRITRESDREYFRQMYPGRVKQYIRIIVDILNRMDVKENYIYDEYPDGIRLERLTEIILRQIPLENNINRETQKDLVRVLLWEEIAERRERKRRDGKTPLENL